MTNYVAEQSRPDEAFFFFSYKMSIQNLSSTSAQLISRHWIITDGFGKSEEVRGPGVVGLQPRITPGQIFEYESACPLPTSTGSMKGSYLMMSDDGQRFQVDIPEFYLVAPQSLH